MMLKRKQNKTTTILLVVLIIILSIFSPIQNTYCADTNIKDICIELNNTVIEELDEIDFSGYDALIEDFKTSKNNIFSISSIKSKVYEIISGESAVNYTNFIASLFSNVVSLILSYLPMLSIIVAIGVVSNLLGGIKSKFNEKSTGDLVHLVCFLSVAILIIGMVNSLSVTTGNSINSMVNQTNTLFPILLTLMVGIGANASVSVFQPIVAIMSTYISNFFNYFIMPLFLINFVFGIVSNISNTAKLDNFSSFITSLFKWSVGLIFTLFFAVFAIQGITAGSFDSISIRTTKYTIKSYVPVMGGYLSDGMDLILSSTLLIKNTVGLVGVLLIISTILSPLLEIVIFSLVLKLLSAILQPMGNNKTVSFLSSTSKAVTMLSASIIAIGFMYLISIGLVMTTSNVVIWWMVMF